MHLTSKPIGTVVVLTLLLGLVGLSSWAQPVHSQGGSMRSYSPSPVARPLAEQPDVIQLRSRQFAPAAGVEPGLGDALRATPGKVGGRAHVLLQLRDVPSQAILSALEAAGIRLLNYVPQNGWFASLPADDVEATLTRPGIADVVRWAGQIQAEDKIEAGVWAGEFGSWAIADEGRVRLAASFFDDVHYTTARQVVAAHGGTLVGEIKTLNQLHIVLDVDGVVGFAAEDAVRWVDQIHPPITTDNDDARRATRVDDVQALPYDLYGMGVTVGIWDGGAVEASHDDFEDQIGASRVTAGDAVAVSNHSTHVAGTVAGNGARSAALGGTYRQWRGMAPQAAIVSYDFNGDLDAEHLQGIVTHGIDVSQNSWGYIIDNDNCDDFGSYVGLAPMFDHIVTGGHGRRISVVFSVGNERNDGDQGECGLAVGPNYVNYHTIQPPSTAKNVVTVGATNSNDDTMTTFSGWGPTDDGRLKPEVVAPGCERDRDRDDEVYTRTMWSAWPGNGYGGMCGTSMAAPTVSGIGALLMEQYGRTYGAVAPLPSTIRALLVHGARDLDDGTSWYNPGPDYASGYGIVDTKASVDLIIARAVREGAITSNKQTDVFTVMVPADASLLKVTLAWDDPAATENVTPTLVNDLDLTLIGPSTVVRRPWILDRTNPSANATRGSDHANNLEQVLVGGPEAGEWQIVVHGFSVPQAPQPYSLVSEALAFENVFLPLVLRAISPGTPNRPPNSPSSPSPPAGGTDQDVDVALSWTGGDLEGDDVTYDVYVVDGDTASPDVLACYDLTTTICDPGTLAGVSQYSWQVIATDEHGARTVGPAWAFTTEAAPTNPWTVILSEGFEGSFPGVWTVGDNNGSTGGTYYWAKRDCETDTGTFSAWAVGGGDGPLSCGSNYPNRANSWMIYGPFSLADATAADLAFRLLANTQANHDFVFWMASTDGLNFAGPGGSGSTGGGWTVVTLDLASVPQPEPDPPLSLLGRDEVWIALIFSSDAGNNYPEGAHVDNLVIRKCTYTTCTGTSTEATWTDGARRAIVSMASVLAR